MTEFGVCPLARPQDTIRQVGELAKAAEQYGFHTLWMPDTPLSSKDPYIALTLAALNTRSLHLGPGVSNSSTRHLSISVNAISTLDDLSGGRAILGFGNGGRGSMNSLGYATPTVAEFRETLKNLRALMWGEGVVTNDTIQYSVPSVQRRIPIYMAAWGPRMLQLAGELADGAMIAGEAQKDSFARKVQLVREGAMSSGRDPGEVKINLILTVSSDPDRGMAIDTIRPYVAYLALRSPSGWTGEIPSEHAEAVRRIRRQLSYSTASYKYDTGKEMVPDSLVEFYSLIGTDEECRERLAEILSLKPDGVTFYLRAEDQMGQLEKLAALIQS